MYRNKFIITIVSVLFILAVIFGYVFGIFQNKNEELLAAVTAANQTYEQIDAEQRSFAAGKRDMEELSHKTYQPDSFFSTDTKLVKEIKTLEELATASKIGLTLQVSGTAAAAAKVPATSGTVFSIPYTMTLSGSFAGITAFMAATERLPFITHIKAVTLAAEDENKVRAVLTTVFFIKK
jgi:Tfp pilus assembly protein PilO